MHWACMITKEGIRSGKIKHKFDREEDRYKFQVQRYGVQIQKSRENKHSKLLQKV